MKKNLIQTLIILTLFSYLPGESRVIKFPMLNTPNSIVVDANRLFITDKTTIFIFSKGALKLIKKFGQEGDGPKEFRVRPYIHHGGIALSIFDNQLIINSIGKVSFYSKEGEFIKELKTNSISASYLPIGQKYLGTKAVQDLEGREFNTINIFNRQLSKIREVYRQLSWDERKSLDLISYTQFPIFYSYKDKIFINGKKGEGKITVFDNCGKKLYEIKHPYKKTKLSKRNIQNYLDFFNKSPGYKSFLKNYEKIIKFPKYYPILRNFHIENNKIYLVTFSKDREKRECYIFTIKGKFLKRVILKIPRINPIRLTPYTTSINKLYTLIENLESEEWELHISDIK